MVVLAPGLVERPAPAPAQVQAFIVFAVIGGAAWFAAIGPLERLPPRRAVTGAVLLFGAALRVGWFGTPLVLDTDALRYLWDGGLVAHRLWPWGAPPSAGVPAGLGEAAAALHAELPP